MAAAPSSARWPNERTKGLVGTLRPPASGLPAGDEKRRAVREMFDTIAGSYDLLNRVNSLGMDRGWRRRCVSALELPAGSLVLDVACGTGDLCDELARQRYRPVGLDLSPGMLAQARARTAHRVDAGAPGRGERGPAPAPLVLADALGAPFRPAYFDGAVSAFALRNVVDLGQLFRQLAYAVRPGGRISLLELSRPETAVLRFGHGLWCNYAVPLVGSLFSDAPAYRYLPKSLAYLPPPEEVVGMLEGAGFAAVQRVLLAGGTCQIYLATAGRHLAPRTSRRGGPEMPEMSASNGSNVSGSNTGTPNAGTEGKAARS